MRQRVTIERYGIEGWRRRHVWLEVLSEFVAILGLVLAGVGLGWILQVFHAAGMP